MTQLVLDKRSRILNLMSDNKPRSLPEIQKTIGEKCNSSVFNLYEKGILWATDIKYFMHAIAYKGGGKWKRPHGRQRWYLIPKEDEKQPVTRQITYLQRDRSERNNIEKTETMVFAKFSRKKTTKISPAEEERQILGVLAQSNTALFPAEIAEKAAISERRVISILFRITNNKVTKVHKSGWRNKKDTGREEQRFKKGYLYYLKLEQLKSRIERRDVLGGQKQAIYDRIRKVTEVDRQFTKLTNIARELGIYSTTVADYLEEVMSVYQDLKKEEIGGSNFYYIDGIMAEQEVQCERENLKTGRSQESSYKLALGKVHEDFCQFAIDKMLENGDFKIGEDCWWREVVGRNGKRRRRDIFLNSLDSSRRYEYDAILNVKTPLGNEPNILVWEMKYRGTLTREFYDRLIEKLSDTTEFSTLRISRQPDGNLVKIKTGPSPFKANITPIFVIPTTGKKNIDVAGNSMNFAQYVTSQGGKIVFTQEFERILHKYYPYKKIQFHRLFAEWWKEKDEIEFQPFLEKYLTTN